MPLRRSGLRARDRSADAAAREAQLASDRGEGQAMGHNGGVAQDGARGEHPGTQTAAPELAGRDPEVAAHHSDQGLHHRGRLRRGDGGLSVARTRGRVPPSRLRPAPVPRLAGQAGAHVMFEELFARLPEFESAGPLRAHAAGVSRAGELEACCGVLIAAGHGRPGELIQQDGAGSSSQGKGTG
jgi:hypothetical protein